jgi:hypothetical protein
VLRASRSVGEDLPRRQREEGFGTSDCRGGVPHPGCFVQRVRKRMKTNELSFARVQKSAHEYEKKGDSSKARWKVAGLNVERRGAHPLFFVSVAGKGLSEAASLLFATLAWRSISVAVKGLMAANCGRESNSLGWEYLEGAGRLPGVRGLDSRYTKKDSTK